MTVTQGKHPDYPEGHEENVWDRHGNDLNVVSVKYLSIKGTIRIVPGTYTVIWDLGVRDDAEGITCEVLDIELVAQNSGKQLVRQWDMSKASRNEMSHVELGTLQVLFSNFKLTSPIITTLTLFTTSVWRSLSKNRIAFLGHGISLHR